MVDAIIFDIGNVLLRFDFGQTLSRIAPLCSVSIGEIPSRLEPWKVQLESGRMDGSAFLEKAAEVLGYTGSHEVLQKAWQEIFSPIAPMHALVATLSQPLYLLSNTNGLHAEYFLSEYPVFRHFTDAVYSHEAGVMKPDPAIYHHALEKFGLSPQNTLFIDDLLPNIEAADSLGLLTHHYHHERHEAFLAELRRLKVLP
ncbi:MAG: HAD family phosphatase [Verrucomicrobia bacterium]|nr:HAD family phosphatase [Verrucomicrobiota bacterium]